MKDKISALTAVISKKRDLLEETAEKLETSKILNDSFEGISSKSNQCISLLLQKKEIEEILHKEAMAPGERILKDLHDDEQTQLILACKNGDLEVVSVNKKI